MPTSYLLSLLQAKEQELHRTDVRRDVARLGALLHHEFEELGRSGLHYSRADVLARLPGEEAQPVVVADHFVVCVLAPGVALLTYRSAHVSAEGTLVRHTLRSSVWLQVGAGWQLRYHQGTPAAMTLPNT